MPTTVLLVHYNNDADTQACLASLARAGAPGVLVVDNASASGDIRPAVAQYPGEATYRRMKENVGFGRANNAGLRLLMRREVARVWVLNNDTLVTPGALEALEQALDDHPKAALATPRTVYADAPDVLWYGGGFVDWSRGTARTPGYNGSATAPLALEARPVAFASGCAMLLRMDALRAVGGFDPRYFMYEEDVELSLRLVRAGYTLRYVPDALIHHRVGGSQRSQRTGVDAMSAERSAFLAYHQTRNQVLTAARHARGADVGRFLWGFASRRLALMATAPAPRWGLLLRAVLRGLRDAAVLLLADRREATSPVSQAALAAVRPEASEAARPAAEVQR